MIILFPSVILFNSRVFINSYLDLINKQIIRIISSLFGIIVGISLSVYFVNHNAGIVGIALSISFAYIMISIILFYNSFMIIFNERKYVLLSLLKLILITLLLSLILHELSVVKVFTSSSYLTIFVEMILRIFIFVFSKCFLFVVFFQNFRIFEEIKSFLFSIIHKLRVISAKNLGFK